MTLASSHPHLLDNRLPREDTPREAMRPSDELREKTALTLSRRCAEGYISPETLEQRLELAYTAKHTEVLDRLTADLPEGRLRRLLSSMARLVGGPPRPQPIVVAPPHPAPRSENLVIGRSPRCNLVLNDPTVSRRHAALRREDEGWRITDLGSTNGTWVNGWRVDRALVRDGDELVLGGLAAVFSDRAVAPSK